MSAFVPVGIRHPAAGLLDMPASARMGNLLSASRAAMPVSVEQGMLFPVANSPIMIVAVRLQEAGLLPVERRRAVVTTYVPVAWG